MNLAITALLAVIAVSVVKLIQGSQGVNHLPGTLPGSFLIIGATCSGLLLGLLSSCASVNDAWEETVNGLDTPGALVASDPALGRDYFPHLRRLQDMGFVIAGNVVTRGGVLQACIACNELR